MAEMATAHDGGMHRWAGQDEFEIPFPGTMKNATGTLALSGFSLLQREGLRLRTLQST